MFELLGWDIGMSALAALLLVGVAALIGIASYFIGEVRVGYEGVLTGLGALVGGYLGSEAFGTTSTWGWEFQGLYVLPALIGALLVGGIVDAVVRFLTGGTYTYEPRPI